MTGDDLLKLSNKSQHPHYYPLYRRYLYHRREVIQNVLELGVLRGGSLLVWAEWFQNAQIVGVDNCPELADLLRKHPNPRIDTCKCDQADKDTLTALCRSFGGFDLIVDDAGHDPFKQAESLSILWPHLRSGGWYVVEDLDSSFQNPELFTDDRGIISTCYLQTLGMTLKYAGLSSKAQVPLLEGLAGVHFHPNIVFLEKQ